MASLTVDQARNLLRVGEDYTREQIKDRRDANIKTCILTIALKRSQIKNRPYLKQYQKDTINAEIENQIQEMEKIKDAYRILKAAHRETHSSTAHNRFTNARKGVTGIFSRIRKGVSGLASRMYTRRNNQNRSRSRSRASASRESASRNSGSGEESKGDGDENEYTRSRRESGAPYGTYPDRNYRNGSSGFGSGYRNYRNGAYGPSGSSGYGSSGFGSSGFGSTGLFRTTQDKKIDKYLQVLGLPLTRESFTTSKVTKAYRSSALRTHPNKNPNKDAEEQFKSVNEAYRELKDSISSGRIYVPPESTEFMPNASSAKASPKASHARSAKASPARSAKAYANASPRASAKASRKASNSPNVFQEKDTHTTKLKKTLGVLGLDPEKRHTSQEILKVFLNINHKSKNIDNAFRILYYNLNPASGPPRTMEMVEAAIEQRKNRYKGYTENI